MTDFSTRHPLLHTAPAAGFEQPFEMLAACHERVRRMLRLLLRLADHLPGHGADRRAADAARDVMRYFDIAGPAHHQDEERHVLPWLAAHGRAALADTLAAEHRRMTEAWALIRADLDGVASGAWQAADAPQQRRRWEDFATLYQHHIEREEAQAFPPVRAASDDAALKRIGSEMAARRGVPSP
jgi:hemerythrin-like domain-containing protein